MTVLQEISRFNEVFARKLSVENVLQGHEGCVNRLAWNEDGTILASGSDDRRVRQDPHILSQRSMSQCSENHEN